PGHARGRDGRGEVDRVTDVAGAVVAEVEVEFVRPGGRGAGDAEADRPRHGGAGGDDPGAEADRLREGAGRVEPYVDLLGAGGAVGDRDLERHHVARSRSVVVERGRDRLLAARGRLADGVPEGGVEEAGALVAAGPGGRAAAV